jgi:hypothetical protein
LVSLFVGAIRAHITAERPVADLLVPPILGAAAVVVPVLVLWLAYRPGAATFGRPSPRVAVRLALGSMATSVVLAIGWSAVRDLTFAQTSSWMLTAFVSAAVLALLFPAHWTKGITAYGLADRHALVLTRGPSGVTVERIPLTSMTSGAVFLARAECGTIWCEEPENRGERSTSPSPARAPAR